MNAQPTLANNAKNFFDTHFGGAVGLQSTAGYIFTGLQHEDDGAQQRKVITIERAVDEDLPLIVTAALRLHFTSCWWIAPQRPLSRQPDADGPRRWCLSAVEDAAPSRLRQS